MTKPSKPKTARRPADRTVYELTPDRSRPHLVEARNAADVAAGLQQYLKFDDATSRAAAHLLHLGATITAPNWSARPLGTMTFTPYQPPTRSAEPEAVTATDGDADSQPAQEIPADTLF